jgi:hypothetical protein
MGEAIMQAIRVDVFGRQVVVEESARGWLVFYVGQEGKRRLAEDIVVPRSVAAEDMVQYLADLCHEWASARHPQVKRLE